MEAGESHLEAAGAEVEATQLEQVLGLLPFAVWLTEPSGRVVVMNRAARRLTDTPLEAPPQRPCDAVVAYWPSGAPLAEGDWPFRRALASGHTVAGVVFRIRCGASGQLRTVVASAKLVRDPRTRAITGVVEVMLDITLLEEAETRFERIVASVSDAIISADDQLRIISFNPGAEQIFGYREAEVAGMPLDVLLASALRRAHRKQLERLLTVEGNGHASHAGAEPHRQLFWGRRKNGEEFVAEAAVSRLPGPDTSLLSLTLRDVTARRKAEEAQAFLADASAQLSASLDVEELALTVGQLCARNLADFAAVELFDEDAHTRRLKAVAASPGDDPIAEALEQLGDRAPLPVARRAVQLGRPVVERELPDDNLASDPDQLKILRLMAPQAILAAPMVARGRPIGVLLLFSTRGTVLFGEREVALVTELCARVSLALEHARAYSRAREESRAREQLLGVVAHDLRTPLNAINIAAGLLLRQLDEEDDGAIGAVRRIQSAVKRMNRLIEDLLNLSRLESGTLQLDLRALMPRSLLEDAVELVRPQAALHVLEISEVEPLPEVRADRDRALQVLCNLMINAVKFTPPGGRISVSAIATATHVEFRVTDQGQGITSENQREIFNWYWQGASGDRRGLGLGLGIARSIVEAHGGRIWVQSRVGEGSTFVFTLPRLEVAH